MTLRGPDVVLSIPILMYRFRIVAAAAVPCGIFTYPFLVVIETVVANLGSVVGGVLVVVAVVVVVAVAVATVIGVVDEFEFWFSELIFFFFELTFAFFCRAFFFLDLFFFEI